MTNPGSTRKIGKLKVWKAQQWQVGPGQHRTYRATELGEYNFDVIMPHIIHDSIRRSGSSSWLPLQEVNTGPGGKAVDRDSDVGSATVA